MGHSVGTHSVGTVGHSVGTHSVGTVGHSVGTYNENVGTVWLCHAS